MDRAPEPTGRIRARRACVLGFALFAFGGPFAEQVLDVKSPYIRSWRMYAGYGANHCVASYFEPGPDGSRVPIDRLKVLFGADHWWEVPLHERQVERRYVEHFGRRLCREGGYADVRADARCATWVRWETVQTGAMNLCREHTE